MIDAKYRTGFLAIGASGLLGWAITAAVAQTRMDAAIDQAYSQIGKEIPNYPEVRRILLPFDGKSPRRMRLDYMIGVATCGVGNYDKGAVRLQNLDRDYIIRSNVIRKAVLLQLQRCQNRQPPAAETDSKGDDENAIAGGAGPENPAIAQMSGLESGWSYNQGDIYSRKTTSPLECAEICLNDPKCKAMTHIKSQKLCWIKDRLTGRRGRSSDMTSAVKLGGAN